MLDDIIAFVKSNLKSTVVDPILITGGNKSDRLAIVEEILDHLKDNYMFTFQIKCDSEVNMSNDLINISLMYGLEKTSESNGIEYIMNLVFNKFKNFYVLYFLEETDLNSTQVLKFIDYLNQSNTNHVLLTHPKEFSKGSFSILNYSLYASRTHIQSDTDSYQNANGDINIFLLKFSQHHLFKNEITKDIVKHEDSRIKITNKTKNAVSHGKQPKGKKKEFRSKSNYKPKIYRHRIIHKPKITPHLPNKNAYKINPFLTNLRNYPYSNKEVWEFQKRQDPLVLRDQYNYINNWFGSDDIKRNKAPYHLLTNPEPDRE